jgi:hypothetical protein
MKYEIQQIRIMNTICEMCYEKDKELQILVISQSDLGTCYDLICAECSVNLKVGDEKK